MISGKNILFDFDGTLMDTWPGIERTIHATLRALEGPVPDASVNQGLVGMPLIKVFETLLGTEGRGAERAIGKYRELFPLVGLAGARPFEGAKEMLEKLKAGERNLFLVTARNERIARRMMEDHGLTGFFTWVRGEGEGEVLNGKAHMVAEVLEKFGLLPADCLFVGDRRFDVDAAKANGVPAVGVTYGYGSREELREAGAGRLADSVRELEEMLLQAV